MVMTITGCGNTTHNRNDYYVSEENDDEEDESTEDGEHTATVEYYNPNTGTQRTYTLNVEVSNNTVTVIHFNNGGWLDETHIESGGELDDDGSTTIYTDKGYEYTVTIDK